MSVNATEARLEAGGVAFALVKSGATLHGCRADASDTVCVSTWTCLSLSVVQGIYWIRQREGSNLQVSRMGQQDLVPRLMRCIEAGGCFLIENMGERIDAVLWPVVSQATIRKGTRRMLR